MSDNQEDHVSMGSIAANQTRKIIGHLQYILAIELLCASQAIDLAGIQDQIAPTTLKTYKTIREIVPMLSEDRELSPDFNSCVELIRKRHL